VKTRALLALSAVLAAGVASGAANAAVKKPTPRYPKVCQLLQDAPGDTGTQGTAHAPIPDDQADILSADIASDAKNLTAVLRLKALGPSDNFAPTGRAYSVFWTAPGDANPLYLQVTIPASGTTAYTWGDITGSTSNSKGSATGAIAGNEIHMTVPLAALKGIGIKVDPGTKFTGLGAKSGNLVGLAPGNPTPATTYATLFYDAAEGGKNYILTQPSCIKVGS
jgi:hypothetical protein